MNKKIISSVIIIMLLLITLSSTCHASASAKVFSNGQSGNCNNCAIYAVDGLGRLGYSPCTSSIGQITKASMLEWINNSGNGYAMYVHTYGGSGYFNDYYGSSINSSNISGNWDFIFIDSSYSAQTNTLANAFHTTGYSNRCFLGWSGTLTTADSELFNYFFWIEYIGGGAAVRTAAINAAGRVPGSGTTPIRLYGSTTYTGAAR